MASYSGSGIEVRCFAAARTAAGNSTSMRIPAHTVGELRQELIARFGQRMADVLSVSSLLIDGFVVSPDADAPLSGEYPVDVLPPFAGG